MTNIVVQHVNRDNSQHLEELFTLNKDRLALKIDIKSAVEETLALIEDAGNEYITYDYLVATKDGVPLSGMAAITRKYHNSWYITGMRLRPGFNVFDCRTNGVRELMTVAVEGAERIGYYSYNFMTKAGKAHLSRFHKMQSQIEVLGAYEYFTELYVPANTLPDKAWYRAILYGRSWDFDCIVRTGMLKEEYRDLKA